MSNWIKSAVTGLMLERPAQKLTLSEHIDQLAQTGEALTFHFASCDDTPANREQLRHIIGIECWSQSRLRVFLGDPLDMDEVDTYRPSEDSTWEELQREFVLTRDDTLGIAETLLERDIDTGPTVPHNQYGKLTAFAWLRYIDFHANLESKRIK